MMKNMAILAYCCNCNGISVTSALLKQMAWLLEGTELSYEYRILKYCNISPVSKKY